MNAALLALFSLGCFALAYRFYARFLSDRLYGLGGDEQTPAHTRRDGVDYVPSGWTILFGHHFTSIAGASPIVGPAIAVIWGWIPAILWVVLGTILAGGVHDLGSLAVSIRHDGSSLGNLTSSIIRSRARTLLLLIVFFLMLLVLAVFGFIIATLFVSQPETVIPINVQIIVALVIGVLFYKYKVPILWPSIIGLLLLYAAIFLGIQYPVVIPPMWGLESMEIWLVLMMGYAFVASVLPVWVLLQPRDYINALILLTALGTLFIGLFVAHPTIVAPAVQLSPEGAPPFLPFLFITIACGAISGFHSMVSSGTTSKQLNRYRDARKIGYGGMLAEGALAVLVICAVSAGFPDTAAWNAHYASWGAASGLSEKLGAFLQGGSLFLNAVGIPMKFGVPMLGVVIVAFAATTMDTTCRIQRYVIAELGASYNIKILSNRYVGSGLAAGTALLLAAMKGGGQGGLILWPVFGGVNQLVAGMALLVISVWLYRQGKPVWYTMVPMIFMVIMTTWALLYTILQSINTGDMLIVFIGACVLALELWLVLEAIAVFRKGPVPLPDTEPASGAGKGT
jgi:carbon starvation protein